MEEADTEFRFAPEVKGRGEKVGIKVDPKAIKWFKEAA